MSWPVALAGVVIVAIVLAHVIDIRLACKAPKRPRTMTEEHAEYRRINKIRRVR